MLCDIIEKTFDRYSSIDCIVKVSQLQVKHWHNEVTFLLNMNYKHYTTERQFTKTKKAAKNIEIIYTK